MLDCPEEAWDKIFDINVKVAFLLFKASVPLMAARGGGSAVFVSSIGGFQPLAALGPYSVGTHCVPLCSIFVAGLAAGEQDGSGGADQGAGHRGRGGEHPGQLRGARSGQVTALQLL